MNCRARHSSTEGVLAELLDATLSLGFRVRTGRHIVQRQNEAPDSHRKEVNATSAGLGRLDSVNAPIIVSSIVASGKVEALCGADTATVRMDV